MNDPLRSTELSLARSLSLSARGPRRNALYALWLFVRACSGCSSEGQLSQRTHRRRLTALEKRLTSVSIPPQLRRTLAEGMERLQEANPGNCHEVLQELAIPVGEALGKDCAELISEGARKLARDVTPEPA